MSLASHYAGDEAWENYAAAWAEFWPKCRNKEALLQAVNSDLPLAQTVFGLFGEQSLEWLHGEVPALNGKTPVACLKSKRGTLAVRECLLRYPYP
jgi:hypothetical protein